MRLEWARKKANIPNPKNGVAKNREMHGGPRNLHVCKKKQQMQLGGIPHPSTKAYGKKPLKMHLHSV